MIGIATGINMQGDREIKGRAEQEGEIDDCITRPVGSIGGLENENPEFNKKEKQGLAAAQLARELSTLGNDMEINHPPLLVHDFYSSEETTQLASYLQFQAEKFERRVQRYYSLHQSRKPSICSRKRLPIKKEEENSLSLSGHNCGPMTQQSKFLSDAFKGLPGEQSFSDMSPNLSQRLNAGTVGHSHSEKKRRSESVANVKGSSLLELMVLQDFSEMNSRPRFANTSAVSKELNDSVKHESVLHSSKNGAGEGEHGGGLRTPRYREPDDHDGGTSCASRLEKWSAGPGSFSILTDVREEIDLKPEFCQQRKPMPIRSQMGFAQEEESLSLQVTPPSISCVDSSECDNFGAEITTRLAADEPSLGNVRSRKWFGEIDAVSEAGELENSKEEETSLQLEVNTSQPIMNSKRQDCGALDLLVTAIQVASGGVFGVDNKNNRTSKMIEKADNRAPVSNREAFVHGWSPIVKKRVKRRAQSAFKKQCEGMAMQSKIYNVAPEVLWSSKSKKNPLDDNQQGEGREHCDLLVPEVAQVKDGEPVIRSKRGRSQFLPTKFSDSVLQPWKRKSRRKHSEKFGNA